MLIFIPLSNSHGLKHKWDSILEKLTVIGWMDKNKKKYFSKSNYIILDYLLEITNKDCGSFLIFYFDDKENNQKIDKTPMVGGRDKDRFHLSRCKRVWKQ